MLSTVPGGQHLTSSHPHPQTTCCRSPPCLLALGPGQTAMWSADTVPLPLCSISLSSECFRHCHHSMRPCSSNWWTVDGALLPTSHNALLNARIFLIKLTGEVCSLRSQRISSFCQNHSNVLTCAKYHHTHYYFILQGEMLFTPLGDVN